MTAAPQADRPPGLTSVPGAAGSTATREVSLSIEGMTCAACAVRVEKKLNRLDEVRATVNYATATARVTAPAALPMTELIAAVEQAGYTPGPRCLRRATGGTDRRRTAAAGRRASDDPADGTPPTCAAG